jgi:branched-subunit amino acid aminotransferase/4-amino-4-deoxychorismate lyase
VTLVALAVVGRGVLPPDTPVLHADDEGVLRGRSVFETLRVYGGMPFSLAAHLDRLEASAALLRLPPPPRDELERTVFEAIAAGETLDAGLRLLWTAGREGGGPPTAVVLVSTLPPGLDELRARGLRVAVVRWAAGTLAGAKSTSYAENMAAQAEAAERGADDALLVSGDGTVLEAPTSNVWFREGSRLLTPSLALPLLAGVTRAAIARLAPQAGYEVEEGSFPLERLAAADEVFLTSSVREVAPVVAIDGEPVGGGSPGTAAGALQRALRVAAGYPDGA